MSEDSASRSGPLPLSLAQQIDKLCDEFEGSWKSNSRPRIEDYLDQVQEHDRPMLLRQLLLLELDYRKDSGEHPMAQEYCTRFPRYSATIDRVFRDAKPPAFSQDTDKRSVLSTGSFAPGTAGDEVERLGGNLGRFEVIRLLGRGAFGSVYLAHDPQGDRPVALKVPRAGLMVETEEVQRFFREARAAGQLHHPNIVPIYESGKIDGTYFIASGFVEGRTLREEVRDRQHFSVEDAATLVSKLASALHYAHSKEIVHRDIKPENVMLSVDGEPHIMDFGLARRDEGEVLRTQEGVRMGTPAYMSPEQHAGQSHLADSRSDLWSLGVIFYELLTGRRPFEGQEYRQVSQAVQQKEPELPRKLSRAIPPDLQTICLKCLAKAPASRYASCKELADDLQRWMRGEPIHARHIGVLGRTTRWVRRNPVVASLASAVVVALLLGAGVSMYFAFSAQLQARIAAAKAKEASSNAEDARSGREQAEQQQAIAEARRAESQRQTALARRSAYILQLQRVDELRRRDPDKALLLLNDVARCPPNMRDFAWGVLYRFCMRDERTLRGHRDKVLWIALSPDGTRLASVSRDETLRIWNRNTGQLEKSVRLPVNRSNTGDIGHVAFAPDGRTLATASCGLLTLWDVESGQEKSRLTKDDSQPTVWWVAFSPDGQSIASASQTSVEIWSVSTYERVGRLDVSTRSVAFSSDGKVLATGGKSAKLWDANTLQELGTLNSGFTRFVAFSPDGKTLALVYTNDIGLWDFASDKRLGSLVGHTDEVDCLSFFPDGKTLASGSHDTTVRLWDVHSRREVASFSTHLCCVNSVIVAPDGQEIASASCDHTIKLWDLTPAPEIDVLNEYSVRPDAPAFTPDGKSLVLVNAAGEIRL